MTGGRGSQMTDMEKRAAAAKFAEDWKGRAMKSRKRRLFGWRCCKRFMAWKSLKNGLPLRYRSSLTTPALLTA